MLNVIPENDDRQHVFEADCWCKPDVRWQLDDGEIIQNGPLIVHNAADCRESVELLLGEGIEGKRWTLYERI
jgi:hypothetical protein